METTSSYLLFFSLRTDGIPLPVGTFVASGPPSRVSGEIALGVEVSSADRQGALELLRSIPPAGDRSAVDWLSSVNGLANGRVRLVGPFEWHAESHEVLNWSFRTMHVGHGRSVALIRDGHVEELATDEPTKS